MTAPNPASTSPNGRSTRGRGGRKTSRIGHTAEPQEGAKTPSGSPGDQAGGTPKEPTARTTARKAPAKKPAARKTPSTKTAAKKAPVKKAAATKKPPAKRASGRSRTAAATDSPTTDPEPTPTDPTELGLLAGPVLALVESLELTESGVALAALALTLATQLDRGAGLATAAVARELRATLHDLEDGSDGTEDEFTDWEDGLKEPV